MVKYMLFSIPICSMVLEYAHQHLPEKICTPPSFVGKYTSTMVRIWVMLN
jgi:hypothetical protein